MQHRFDHLLIQLFVGVVFGAHSRIKAFQGNGFRRKYTGNMLFFKTGNGLLFRNSFFTRKSHEIKGIGGDVPDTVGLLWFKIVTECPGRPSVQGYILIDVLHFYFCRQGISLTYKKVIGYLHVILCIGYLHNVSVRPDVFVLQ